MEEHWGWLIVIYLFLGGLGAGAYLTSFAASKGYLGNAPALKRIGYLVAAPIVAIGTALLVFDLGQGLKKPWLLIGLLANPKSVMTWGVYILSGFIAVGLIVAFLAWKKREIPNVLATIGALLAISTGAYTGLLISVIKEVPIWNTYLMPVLFVISALSTGLSLTVLLGHLLEKGVESNEKYVCKVHVFLVLAEIAVLSAFLGLMISGANGPVAAESAKMIVSGSLALPFWAILVGAGLVFPLVAQGLRITQLSKAHIFVPTAAFTEQAATGHPHSTSVSVIAGDLCLVLGGLVLRYVVILASIPIWNGTLG